MRTIRRQPPTPAAKRPTGRLSQWDYGDVIYSVPDVDTDRRAVILDAEGRPWVRVVGFGTGKGGE